MMSLELVDMDTYSRQHFLGFLSGGLDSLAVSYACMHEGCFIFIHHHSG